MGLQTSFGNAVSGLSNTVQSTISSLSTSLENVVGSATSNLTSLFSGGFVGINYANKDEVVTAINNYCTAIEEHIAQFDENGNLEVAFKGQMQTSAQEFVAAIKALLQAYVSTMRASIDDLEAAFEAMKNADSEVGTQVTSNASEIRSAAQAMRID